MKHTLIENNIPKGENICSSLAVKTELPVPLNVYCKRTLREYRQSI